MVVVQNHLVAPCPAVVGIVVVDVGKAVEHLLDVVNGPRLDVTDQPLLLTLGQQQTTEVYPFTLANGAHGLADITFLLGTLQHGTHVDTEGNVVVLQTLLQRRGIDDILVEVIGRHVVARSLAKGFQDLDALHDFTYGEGAEPVEVDNRLARLLGTLVTLRPFLDVTVETNGSDVASWHQVAVVAVSHQVGERQVARIGMVHQLAEANREGADSGRHQDIGTRGGLCAALQRTVVQGAHLVGVVREVGVGTRIIERELTADEQARLVVGGRERAAERGAGLTVGHVGVSKEQAGLSRETVGNLAGLAHEAILHLHGIVDGAAVADDGVLADNASADKHRRIHRRHHRTLRQARGTADFAVALNDGVGDVLGVDNLHVIANEATLRTTDAQLVLNHLLQRLLQHLVPVMLHHERGHLRVQLTENDDIAVAHLIEHRDDGAFAVGGVVSGLQRADI